MKYKVGDKVKVRTDLVVDNQYGGLSFVVDMKSCAGKEFIIEKEYHGYAGGRYKLEGVSMWVWTDEMLLKSGTFTKLDLKPGMILETKDRKFLIIQLSGGEWIAADNTGFIEGKNFYDNLKCRVSDVYDVQKVYCGPSIGDAIQNLCLSYNKGELLWERTPEVVEMTLEDIAKKIGVPVKSLRIKD